MTNKIAIAIAVMIVALLLADALFLHWNLPVFLGKQLASLIEYLSFWR